MSDKDTPHNSSKEDSTEKIPQPQDQTLPQKQEKKLQQKVNQDNGNDNEKGNKNKNENENENEKQADENQAREKENPDKPQEKIIVQTVSEKEIEADKNYEDSKEGPKSTITKAKTKIFNSETIMKKIKPTISKWIYGKGKTPDKLKILCWNVNGIRSIIRKNGLSSYLHKNNPDIICVTETKINEQAYNKSPIVLQGYSNYFNFCKISSGYSGVAVFSKYLPISMTEDLPKIEHCQEGRLMTLEFQNFFLVVVYIPASGTHLERIQYKIQSYEVSFHEHCEALRKLKTVIVTGDLNVSLEDIDVHKTKHTHKSCGYTYAERKSFQNFLNKGWVDTFRRIYPKKKQFSWWNTKHLGREKGIGRRLDYFLVPEEKFQMVLESTIKPQFEMSDHCPIQLVMDLSKQEQNQNEI